ncbi:isoepoxydon dehydrogenase [Wilcoxina mikolae CBS 423.85]|nr:isoepoxydon dehydrogenase [Wilcoxina mikolae CBS 423.85]
MKLGLEGSHALVTGGTRDLGKSIVKTFLQEGVNVSYCARTVTGEEFSNFPLAGAEASGPTPRAVGTSVDVSDPEALKAWVEKSVQEFGRIDTLICNASSVAMSGEIETWHNSFNVDFMSVIHLTNLTVPYLSLSPHASILIMSSFAGRENFVAHGAPCPTAYGSFKAALLQLVNENAHILGPKGIRINAISPAIIFAEGGPWDIFQKKMPEWVEDLTERIPLGGRMGTPQEVADTVVFLSSPRSGYTSGANVLITGGFHTGTAF